MAVQLYDIKRMSETFSDGVPTITYTPIETRRIEVQPNRMNRWDKGTQYTIDLGGKRYIPTLSAFMSVDSNITASDRITADSGTTDILVLRVYPYEDHLEADLREVDD